MAIRNGFTAMPTNLIASVPLLHVASSVAAEDYYSGNLGFAKEWEYRPSGLGTEPACLGLKRDGVALHVSSFSGDGVVGSVATFYVRDVDALFDEIQASGVAIDLPPTDQTWGNREMYLRDADGNALRFTQPMRMSDAQTMVEP